MLSEIRGGEYDSHASSRTLVGKAYQHGFFWPTTLHDVAEMEQSYEACQIHAKKIHQPAQVKEIYPRGNNKVVIYISLYHDKCLLFMLELY